MSQDNGLGSPRSAQLPEEVNTLMYVTDDGIKWWVMPYDLPA